MGLTAARGIWRSRHGHRCGVSIRGAGVIRSPSAAGCWWASRSLVEGDSGDFNHDPCGAPGDQDRAMGTVAIVASPVRVTMATVRVTIARLGSVRASRQARSGRRPARQRRGRAAPPAVGDRSSGDRNGQHPEDHPARFRGWHRGALSGRCSSAPRACPSCASRGCTCRWRARCSGVRDFGTAVMKSCRAT